MKPGMKMLMMDRVRQGDNQPHSEYGGNTNRRMIGYDRNEPEGRLPMRHIPPHTEMNDRYGPHNDAYSGYDEPRGNAYNGPYDAPRNTWDNPHTGGYGMPEARRRRDKRGRYMMGGMEYDEDDDEDDRPRGSRQNMPMGRGGNSYGDIYAEGTIWAPGAMNRPMSGMMGGEMSQPVDEQTARMWVGKMDGGEHFKPEQADQLRNTICPDCDKWEFFVAINAMYSDYCETAKKFNADKPEYYGHLARDFLKDKDAGPHKLRKYMEMIPKK